MRYLVLLLMTSSFAWGQSQILRPLDGERVEILKSSFTAQEVLEAWGRLRGLNLSVDQDFKKKVVFHLKGKKVFSKTELDSYVSAVVGQSGFTLITFPDSPFVKVLSSRDVRYEPVPVYKDKDVVPEDHSYSQMVYELKHIDPRALARNLRPFLSRYGRVIDDSNMIYVADENLNLRRIGKIIGFLDSAEYARSVKRTAELNKRHETVVKKEKSLIQILSEKEIIFLLIFFLLGGIIGFGTRGYVVKRIEGGW